MLEEKIIVVVLDIKASKNLKFCIATTKQWFNERHMERKLGKKW
jgi:hypothetical protein